MGQREGPAKVWLCSLVGEMCGISGLHAQDLGLHLPNQDIEDGP
jgi:hypothetical protein